MSYSTDYSSFAAQATADARAQFIRRTYAHLAGAILAFIGIEYLLLTTFAPMAEQMIGVMVGSRISWLVVIGAFMGVSWLADRWAQSDQSRGLQYAGLGLYVVALSVIFLPLLYVAAKFAPDAILQAGVLTFCVFLGLTAAVFITRRDFSHIGPILSIGGFLALGAVVLMIFFPPSQMITLIFCFAMVALASGYIIYQTSNIMLHYHTEQYVAAALALFASVMLLFYYILMILMSRGRD
ncbi:MAG: Bax inhibitor-1 family protein [Gemmataceae bacterium]